MRTLLGFVITAALLTPACADHLPDQDLRILTAAPSAKLSTDDLWKDFRIDPAAARRQYFGKAVDVSGRVASFEADLTKMPHVFFGPAGESGPAGDVAPAGEPGPAEGSVHAGQPGVRARLLDERALASVKDVTVGARITLRCFCEGLDAQHDVLLKSCIRP